MKPLYIQTPLLQSQYLKNKLDKNVFFKMEALQPSGSFKIRGISVVCQSEKEAGRTAFVASSGGNAGVAVAYSGMKLNVPTTIFIPSTSHPIYINTIESYGAKVIVAGDVWDAAHEAATMFSKEHNAAYIHPFDHPLLWKGHSTLMDEVSVQEFNSPPDAVILSVGGGGLACGVLEGMHRIGWHDVPLIAVETKGADSFSASLKAGELVTLPKILSRATSLGARRVTERLMTWSREHPIQSVVVTDEEAETGSRLFAKDKRVLVELSSGASLSLVYQEHSVLQPFQTILVIVCGGINISHFSLEGDSSQLK